MTNEELKLPEPTAYIWHQHLGERTKSLRWSKPNQWEYAETVEPLYTEAQVRELLSAHLQHLPLTGREVTDEAEFEIHCSGDYAASACGPREQAWREIQHYAAQYQQDGPVVIYEVTRTKVSPSTDKEGGGEGGADGVPGTVTLATGEVLREGEDYASGVGEVPRG